MLDPDLSRGAGVAGLSRVGRSHFCGCRVGESNVGTDLEDIERATIQRVFEQVKGDKALAGRMLGISRATLYRKLKRYNIGVERRPGRVRRAIRCSKAVVSD